MEDRNDVTNNEHDETSEKGNEDIFSTINFSTFLLSLSTSALVSLGELPDPLKNEKNANLPWRNRPYTSSRCYRTRQKVI